LTISGII